MTLSITQKYLITHGNLIRPIALVLAAAALITPPLIVVLSPVKMQDTWTAIMRVVGFLAFTLIFMNLVIGPLSRYF
jgi:hypothetical protein